MTQTPQQVHVEPMIVSGLTVRTKNDDEFSNKAKLPSLWERFFSEQIIDKVQNPIPNSPIMGIYSQYESDATGYYNVTAGVQVAKEQDNPDLNNVIVQPGQYLLFEDKGVMPQVVVSTWQRIWEFFETQTTYQRNFLTDFELYHDQQHISIYIGIKNEPGA